jgi:hypothetical protein
MKNSKMLIAVDYQRKGSLSKAVELCCFMTMDAETEIETLRSYHSCPGEK